MKRIRFISVLFFIIGLGLLAAAFAFWRSFANFQARATRTEGTVTELSYHHSSKGGSYYPEVEFKTPDGRIVHFSGSTGSNPSSYSRGEHVQVLYDPASPEQAKIDSFSEKWLGPLLLGGLGLGFALIGGGMLFAPLFRRRSYEWLKLNGMRVQAKYEGVTSGNMKVNGRSSYRLKCQWQHPVTQLVYVFLSDNIWFDPAPYVKRDTLEVLVNADNPKQYHVDISFLPKAG